MNNYSNQPTPTPPLGAGMDHYMGMARDLLAAPGVNRGVGQPIPGMGGPGATAIGTPPVVGNMPTIPGLPSATNSLSAPMSGTGAVNPQTINAARSWMGTASGRDAVRASIDGIIQNRRLGIPPVDNSPTYQQLIQNLLAQFRSKQQGSSPYGDLFSNGSGNTPAVM